MKWWMAGSLSGKRRHDIHVSGLNLNMYRQDSSEERFISAKRYLSNRGNPIQSGVREMNFKVMIERDEDGAFVATVPTLPGCISQGDTEEEALENVKEAIELHLESLAADGLPIRREASVLERQVSVTI
jgi:predicted RNase H-like HicB family nuclease